ncbi:MAG TPA: SDR family oxidoreductase [Opitutaceae bacterium]|nr:SDR family oxidoreductase [Opitutaceae bacterium]
MNPAIDAVLITGASSGIGLELAREFARHGHNLIIVAPVAAELNAVASAFGAEFAVKVQTIAADLTDAAAIGHVVDEVAGTGWSVGILANNAGFGRLGRFWEVPLDEQIAMIRLNVEAGVRLVGGFLPEMLARGRGRILNTASIAGFQPGPNLAVYHATKAFMLSWSESLATELEPAGITVTALCPGPVDTDFMTKAHMVDTRAFQEEQVLSPQEVAEKAYEGLMAGKRIVVPGAMNKAMLFGARILPESWQARMSEKMYEPTDPAERKRERGDVETAAARERQGG